MSTPPTLPPAAWFPDPQDPSLWRWWDGAKWTEHQAPRQSAQAEVAPVTDIVETTVSEVVVVDQTENGGAVTSVARGSAVRRKKRQETQQLPTIVDVVAQFQREAPRHPLEEQVEVAGETFHVKGIKRVFAEAGVPITSAGSTIENIECILVPEPWNPHDPNAVAVTVGPHHVGYLPADMAVNYSEPLATLAHAKRLATGEARIWALSDSGVIRARVTILIPEAEAFE